MNKKILFLIVDIESETLKSRIPHYVSVLGIIVTVTKKRVEKRSLWFSTSTRGYLLSANRIPRIYKVRWSLQKGILIASLSILKELRVFAESSSVRWWPDRMDRNFFSIIEESWDEKRSRLSTDINRSLNLDWISYLFWYFNFFLKNLFNI